MPLVTPGRLLSAPGFSHEALKHLLRLLKAHVTPDSGPLPRAEAPLIQAVMEQGLSKAWRFLFASLPSLSLQGRLRPTWGAAT